MPTNDNFDEKAISTRESDLRWHSHNQLHIDLQNKVEVAKTSSDQALKVALSDHHREHEVHERSHEREHQFTKDALDKADQSLEKRLESMNEFRAQLNNQAATFVTRDVFETYKKEQEIKAETALAASIEKYDTLMRGIVNRHDTDTENAQKQVLLFKESLSTEIQNEREFRKTFEGSMNTWKWIVGFLGASGVAGVILLFATGPS